MSLEADFEELVATAALDAWQLMCHQTGAVYLYYMEGGPETWGRIFPLVDGAPVPEGAALVMPERLSRNKEVWALHAYIRTFARKLPLLPSDPNFR